jgi:pimeloyl-ACP methyl ester carboxylesterase
VTETRLLRLPDGRLLAAAEFGDPSGRPLFYFHGYPGSRLEAALGHAAASRRGVRLIALDRPGFGRSDSSPGRRLSDWPGDVEAAADELGLDRFAVAGVSGGGPFAAACAARLGERLTAAGVICGLGPPRSRHRGDGMMWHNRLGLDLAARVPWLARPVLGAVGPLLPRLCNLAIANLKRHVAACDRETLADPVVLSTVSTAFREGLSRGGAGMAEDGRIFGKDWDFDPAAIRVPVLLWHGEQDRVVPASMGRWVAAAIPETRATYYPEEGHFSIVVRRIEEIFCVLQ